MGGWGGWGWFIPLHIASSHRRVETGYREVLITPSGRVTLETASNVDVFKGKP